MSANPPTTGGSGVPTDLQPTDWSAATQRVRDTASWIVKAFVALAVVLVGSGPLLTKLQNLQSNSRGFLAITAAVIGLIAIGVVIWLAANVNLTQIIDIGDLLAPTDSDTQRLMQHISSGVPRDVYLGGRSVDELLQIRRANVSALASQTTALVAVPEDKVPRLQQLISISSQNIAQVDALLANVTGWVGYERVRSRFDRAKPLMFLASAIAAVAVAAAIGILSTKPAKPPTSLGDVSSSVAGGTLSTLQWSTGPTAHLMRSRVDFGTRSMAISACDKIGVLKSGGSGSDSNPWQLTVLPNDPCPVKVHFFGYSRLAKLTVDPLLSEAQDLVYIKERSTVGGWDIALYIALGGLGAGLVLIATLVARRSLAGT